MNISEQWLGRLVRVLLLFRSLVLLITLATLPRGQQKPAVAVLVLAAVILTYIPLRYWDRVSSSLRRHPAYLGLEVVLATVILAAAGARSPFFYFTLGTAALAGVIYGRRGAIPFSLLLAAGYEWVAREGFPNLHPLHGLQSLMFAPLLYPAAVLAGIAAREVVERGVVTESLLRERTEALATEQERVRVARELHDSLAKTVEGLAMTASVLPKRCERDPAAAAELARQLVTDARQAALEARALMSDLRPTEAEMPLLDAVRGRAESMALRSGVEIRVEGESPDAEPAPERKHELLRILGEALINAVRHGGAAHVTVSLINDGPGTCLSIADDGCGLDEPVDFERLKAAGHFGLAGMHERARGAGGTLTVDARADRGTVVTVRLPDAERSARSRRPSSRLRWRLGRRAGAAPAVTADASER